MEDITFSSAAVGAFALCTAAGILYPFILALLWRRISGEQLRIAVIGAAAFFLAGTVRIIARFIFIGENSPLRQDVFAFYAAQALLSAVVEESARYITFKKAIPDRTARSVSVMYGIGHDGFEGVIVAGIQSAQYLALALFINSHGIAEFCAGMTPEEAQSAAESISSLADSAVSMSVTALLSLLPSVACQIAMSVMVFAAVRRRDSMHLLLAALAVHFVTDFIPAAEAAGIASMETVTAVRAVFDLCAAWFAYRIYNRLPYL